MDYRVSPLAGIPHRRDDVQALNRRSWPRFMLYGDTPSWDALYDELADSLLMVVDPEGALAAAGFTVPVELEKGLHDLPERIEDIIVNGLENRGRTPNVLMAVAAVVDRQYRGQGLSSTLLSMMKGYARQLNIADLLIPVRPTWKARYPLQSIHAYATWKRADGLFYDPWLRTHQRLGAQMVACVDCTYTVEGSIEAWQAWTQMVFPESGRYIVEGALQPVVIDVENDRGVYEDPNVWMHHRVT